MLDVVYCIISIYCIVYVSLQSFEQEERCIYESLLAGDELDVDLDAGECISETASANADTPPSQKKKRRFKLSSIMKHFSRLRSGSDKCTGDIDLGDGDVMDEEDEDTTGEESAKDARAMRKRQLEAQHRQEQELAWGHASEITSNSRLHADSMRDYVGFVTVHKDNYTRATNPYLTMNQIATQRFVLVHNRVQLAAAKENSKQLSVQQPGQYQQDLESARILL